MVIRNTISEWMNTLNSNTFRKEIVRKFIIIYQPFYNYSFKDGSCLGFKHSEETLLKFKNRDTETGHITIIINKEINCRNEYQSVRAAAKSTGVSHTTLLRYINRNKLLNGIYIVTKIILNN